MISRLIFELNRGIHFFNKLSIYRHQYMLCVSTEYWSGHRRKKILTLGKLTFWVRDEND